jgi:hypothetical protein
LYVPRNPGDASYKEVKVKRSNKDEVLAQCLAQELIKTTGDSLAFAGVLIDLYKNSNRTIKNDLNTAKKLGENKKTDHEQPTIDNESKHRLTDCIVEDITVGRLPNLQKR